MRIISLIPVLMIFLFVSIQTVMAANIVNIDAGGIDMGVGHRYDRLNWNIAGNLNGENPNILSELEWTDIEILQLQFSGWLVLHERIPFLNKETFLQADLSIGTINSGKVRDSDYSADNRNDEWSRSISAADKGYVFDLSGAVGPIYSFDTFATFSITPLLGYGFNLQNLAMTDGVQTIATAGITPDIGPFDGNLNNSYVTYWYGPWIGLNVEGKISKKIKLATGVEYHWVEYFAQADWNLRNDFDHPVSFEHETTGDGVVCKLDVQYEIDKKWSLQVGGNWQHWGTVAGSVRTFMADGSVNKTRLNEVNWNSYALTVGFKYSF